MRNNDPKIELQSAIFILLLVVLCFIFFSSLSINYLSNAPSDSNKFITNFILLPYFLFALINLLMYLLNINPTVQVLAEDERGMAVMFSSLGFSVRRVIFPLASGLNEYSSYIGGVLCLSFWYLLTYKKGKIIMLAVCGMMLLSLLFVDSRAALIYPILISLVIFILYKFDININVKFISFLVVVGPLVFVYLLPLLASDSALSSALSRHNNDIATGNTRFTIWEIALKKFESFEPIHLVGWGSTGHFASGASLRWAYLFGGWKNANMKSPHSTVFSILFDEGYLGLIIYVALLFQSFNRASKLWRYKPITASAFIIFLIYNIMAGFSESLGGLYLINYAYLFFIVIITLNTEYYFIDKRQYYVVTTLPS
ncbi:hypothetical protein A0256_22695 [Mucilaginibacter sp. PAMC 26640]|nr:hypothetical protein A0256_22695 [Mucilaginibacter sp. PAMC 26640]